MAPNQEVNIDLLRTAAREAVAAGDTWMNMGRRMFNNNRNDVGQQFQRAVGDQGYFGRGSKKPAKKTCAYDYAIRLAKAIGIDPTEVGL